MTRVRVLCVFLSFLILQCLSQEQDPSVGEYFLEAVDLMNRTRWRYFLPEDSDIDQDGNLSDLEVQHKFNTYMGEVFKLIDHDKDNSITEEEFRSLKLDIPHLTKVVDIAFENFPLRPFFLAADGNGDGVYDETDFYMPEKKYTGVAHLSSSTLVEIDGYSHKVTKGYGTGVGKIGQNEGTVICKSLGYDGLEKVLKDDEMKSPSYTSTVVTYSCDGTEDRLEDCVEGSTYTTHYRSNKEADQGMGVVCKDADKLGALSLVGGKDSASGDIFLGKQGLTCNPWDYRHNNAEVICRELGYSGVVRMTLYSAFTGRYVNENTRVNKKLHCNGNEQRLEDCPRVKEDCYDSSIFGVICATDGKTGIDQGLSDLLAWPRNAEIWEDGGRFLFIADANGDGKLTVEELATKGKELMTKILEFLDFNQDGVISLEDINLHLSLGPIQNLVSELFDDVTAGEGEIDLYNMKIAGQDMSNIWGYGLKDLDNSRDEKLTAADVFQERHQIREKVIFLIPMLSQKLDKNQDGKIQREELREFIDEMFNHVDMDKDGVVTYEDAYILLRENGLDCLDVGALRSWMKVFHDTLDAETRNFFGYAFHQFDVDGDGQISPTELQQMHVPCEAGRRYYGPQDYDSGSNMDSDPNAKKYCGDMFLTFYGWMRNLFQNFPRSSFTSGHGRGGYRIKRWGGDGHGRGKGGRDEPRKETLVDKLTNQACEMLT